MIVALFSAGIRLDRPLGLRHWSSTARLIAVAMPLTIAGVLAIYGLAEVVSAYGFLAAFAGGLAFRRREREYHRPVTRAPRSSRR